MITGFHHVGCLVANIEEALEDYKKLHPGGEVSEVYDIEAVKAKVCFFSIGTVLMEFVAPYEGNTSLLRMLDKKPGFYHIGIFTDDIDKEIERLEQEGYRKINKFTSVAFGNRYCAFLYNHEMHLIELIEAEPA